MNEEDFSRLAHRHGIKPSGALMDFAKDVHLAGRTEYKRQMHSVVYRAPAERFPGTKKDLREANLADLELKMLAQEYGARRSAAIHEAYKKWKAENKPETYDEITEWTDESQALAERLHSPDK